MRAQRYLIGAAVVLGAVGIMAGSLVATKKGMYATAYTAIHPMEALSASNTINMCPGQTSSDMDGSTVGTSSSPVHKVSVGHALNHTWDFPSTAACYGGRTDCVAPGGTTAKKCGGRNLSDELSLTGSYYGSAIMHTHSDQSIGRTAFYGTTSGSVPAKGLRATMTSSPNAYLGECFTIEESNAKHFAREADITSTNCTAAADCTKYCVYSLDLL